MIRPFWGTAAAIYNWIAGVLKVLLGLLQIILAAAAADALNAVVNTLAPRTTAAGLAGSLVGFGIVMGMVMLLSGILSITGGYGLWMLRSWGRIIAVVLHGLFAFLYLALAVLMFSGGLTANGFVMLLLTSANMAFLIGLLLRGTALFYNTGAMMPVAMQTTQFAGGLATYPSTAAISNPTGQLPPTQVAPAVQTAATNAFARPGAAGVARTELANAEQPVLAWLVEQGGPRSGKEHRMMQQVTIGRDPARCEVVLDDSKVSGEHARIRMEQGAFVLYDLASMNHTYVNGQQVQKHALRDGDQIRCGPNTLLVFMRVGK